MQEDFQKLISWSAQFNHLPWRQNRSLYRTLVSEIMLQQTTVATVINKFEGFLEQYPTIQKLALATEEEVLVAWKGLGYYRRAKNLLAAAKYISTNFSTNIPTDYNQLVAIPGIGDYTANALLAIGNNQKALAVDTNLERVLARYYGLDIEKGVKLKKTLLELFENNAILNVHQSFAALNEALMDLGRECCTNSAKVNCVVCPLQKGCKSKQNPQARPISIKERPITHDLALLRILIIEDNQLYCYQKVEGEWLAGQWECPTFIVNGGDNIKQYPLVSYWYENLKSFKTSITKYKISNYLLKITLDEFYNLFPWGRQLHKRPIANYSNFSTATQKALHYAERL